MSDFSAADHRHMARAISLARRGLYTTHPNPRVGCVLVRDGEVVGEGWHVRAGEAHAEVNALRAAGAAARGSCAYVTLEPCSHFGRTPPCADALIEAGVSRVVAAMQDPNPRVAGQGLRRLAEAGIDVSSGLLADSAEALNPGFVSRMRLGRPWVRVKQGASLDGRTALASGASQWITGSAARQDVQLLRARADCILTGIGTLLADDPSLNVRIQPPGVEPESLRQPLRVVLDSELRTPPQARMLTLPGRTLIVTLEARIAAVPVYPGDTEVVAVPAGADGRPDLRALMQLLAAREINEVHVEAGAVLGGALLSAGLLDELVLYLAPCLLGDASHGLFHLPELVTMEQRIELGITEIRQIGRDWRVSVRPQPAIED